MLSIPRTTRVFLATSPTDMRKGFDGLFALVENVIREAPFSGHLFVFCNRKRDRLKVLWWDTDGLAIFYKRLWPAPGFWSSCYESDGVVSVGCWSEAAGQFGCGAGR